MELKDILHDYKLKSGVSDAEIARRCNVNRSTVSRWVNGSVKHVYGDTLKTLSEMVGFNIEPAIKGMDIRVQLPVLGYVKAGYDLFAEENYLGEESATMEDARDGDFYLKVTGDSMNGAGIMDGSLVLVRQCSRIDSGKIGVILIGDEVTVKKVVYKGRVMILEAANPEVENRYFDAKEISSLPVRVIGQVISCKTYF